MTIDCIARFSSKEISLSSHMTHASISVWLFLQPSNIILLPDITEFFLLKINLFFRELSLSFILIRDLPLPFEFLYILLSVKSASIFCHLKVRYSADSQSCRKSMCFVLLFAFFQIVFGAFFSLRFYRNPMSWFGEKMVLETWWRVLW